MRTKNVLLAVLGLVMVPKVMVRAPAVSDRGSVRLEQITEAEAVQSLAPVPSKAKLVAFVQPVWALKVPLETLKPVGALQVPRAVVQAWNFRPCTALEVPRVKENL